MIADSEEIKTEMTEERMLAKSVFPPKTTNILSPLKTGKMDGDINQQLALTRHRANCILRLLALTRHWQQRNAGRRTADSQHRTMHQRRSTLALMTKHTIDVTAGNPQPQTLHTS